MLSWRQSSYFDAIHWRTSVPLCTVDVAMFLRQRDEKTNKRKSEMNWSRIEKFLFFLLLLLSDESLVEAGTLFEGEKPLIAIMVSSYRVVFFVFLIYFCFAFLFSFFLPFALKQAKMRFSLVKRETRGAFWCAFVSVLYTTFDRCLCFCLAAGLIMSWSYFSRSIRLAFYFYFDCPMIGWHSLIQV